MGIIMNALATLFNFTLVVAILVAQGRNVIAEEPDDGKDCPPMVSRENWSAEPPRTTENFPSVPDYVVICHTATEGCCDHESCSAKMRAMQNFHKNQLLWDDIGYNFVVGDDGVVYEGRGWDHVGAHSGSTYNRRSIAVAFIGTFVDHLPKEVALNAAQTLLGCGVSKGKIPSNYTLVGHSQVKPTASPGAVLFEKIKTWPQWTSVVAKKIVK